MAQASNFGLEFLFVWQEKAINHHINYHLVCTKKDSEKIVVK